MKRYQKGENDVSKWSWRGRNDNMTAYGNGDKGPRWTMNVCRQKRRIVARGDNGNFLKIYLSIKIRAHFYGLIII